MEGWRRGRILGGRIQKASKTRILLDLSGSGMKTHEYIFSNIYKDVDDLTISLQ